MTDWNTIARVRLNLPPEATADYSRILSELQTVFVELKKRIPADAEPSPVFQPIWKRDPR